jgi:hypothetical protein
VRVLLVLFFASGCIGDLVDTPTSRDASMHDGGTIQTGDGGGGPVTFAEVMGDAVGLGCAASSCHGGTQPPHLAEATDAPSMMANYSAFVADANMGASSLVLSKNLARNGINHAGGKPFADTTDPIYVRWLDWINQGNPQ